MRKQSYNLILRWVAALALCAAALAAGALLSRGTAPGGGGVLISEVLASNSGCPAPDDFPVSAGSAAAPSCLPTRIRAASCMWRTRL